MQKAIEHGLLKAAEVIEEKIDEEIQHLDDLKIDDIEELRERRLREMKKQQKMRQEFLSKGHGNYEELKEEKEFFEIMKKSDRIVLHFYRNETPRCKIFDHHLATLAKKHVETRFCKLLADGAVFIATRLGVRVIPTLVLVKDSGIKDYIVGFTELGNRDDFSTEMLEWRIAVAGIINYEGDLLHPPDEKHATPKPSYLTQKSTIRGRADDDDSDGLSD